jgi:hypothetical protein
MHMHMDRESRIGFGVIAALIMLPVMFWFALGGGLYVISVQDHFLEICLAIALAGLVIYALAADRYWTRFGHLDFKPVSGDETLETVPREQALAPLPREQSLELREERE